MTDDEKKNRALAVETLYQIYKKYYPRWVRDKAQGELLKNRKDKMIHSSKK